MVLVLASLKYLIDDWVKIPPPSAAGIVVAVVAASIAASRRYPAGESVRRQRP